jgi:hypothetical protein
MKRTCGRCGGKFYVLKTTWLKPCPYCGAPHPGAPTPKENPK